jgi:hypothetical protein
VLVRSDGLLIGQPAHAWVSGQLARAWGGGGFPAPSPREPVCLAAEQHDVGWADADLEPLRGASRRPLSFVEYPRPEHVAIWRGAARRMLAQSRYAALLASLHGTSLYQRHVNVDAQPPETARMIRSYLDEQRVLQAALAAGLDPAEVDRNRRLILALDGFSLALCHERAATLDDVPGPDGAATIRLEPAAGSTAGGRVGRDDEAVPPDARSRRFTVAPWPFAAERVVVGCEAIGLDGDLAVGPWVPLRWELSPT